MSEIAGTFANCDEPLRGELIGLCWPTAPYATGLVLLGDVGGITSALDTPEKGAAPARQRQGRKVPNPITT